VLRHELVERGTTLRVVERASGVRQLIQVASGIRARNGCAECHSALLDEIPGALPRQSPYR